MTLENLLSTDPTWGLNFIGEMCVGPLSAFNGSWPDLTVTVIQSSTVPPGEPIRKVHIRENAQEFDIIYHRFDGYEGLYHEHGKNWILWSTSLNHVFVSQAESTWLRTWTYARFILRHFIVGHLLSQPGYRRLHAVAGPLQGTTSGVLIAGPYLSGKTYLLERLIENGLVTGIAEDDCAVIDPEWHIHCLLPQENAMCRLNRFPISIMVCLDKTSETMREIPTVDAVRWALPIQASWPLAWLPGGFSVDTSMQRVPGGLLSIQMPERPDAEAGSEMLRRLMTRLGKH